MSTSLVTGTASDGTLLTVRREGEAKDRVGLKVSYLDLQHDSAIQFGVLRQIHLAHSARSNLGLDFVTIEFGAGYKRHLSLRIKWIVGVEKQGSNRMFEFSFNRGYSLNKFHWEIPEFI